MMSQLSRYQEYYFLSVVVYHKIRNREVSAPTKRILSKVSLKIFTKKKKLTKPENAEHSAWKVTRIRYLVKQIKYKYEKNGLL